MTLLIRTTLYIFFFFFFKTHTQVLRVEFLAYLIEVSGGAPRPSAEVGGQGWAGREAIVGGPLTVVRLQRHRPPLTPPAVRY